MSQEVRNRNKTRRQRYELIQDYHGISREIEGTVKFAGKNMQDYPKRIHRVFCRGYSHGTSRILFYRGD